MFLLGISGIYPFHVETSTILEFASQNPLQGSNQDSTADSNSDVDMQDVSGSNNRDSQEISDSNQNATAEQQSEKMSSSSSSSSSDGFMGDDEGDGRTGPMLPFEDDPLVSSANRRTMRELTNLWDNHLKTKRLTAIAEKIENSPVREDLTHEEAELARQAGYPSTRTLYRDLERENAKMTELEDKMTERNQTGVVETPQPSDSESSDNESSHSRDGVEETPVSKTPELSETPELSRDEETASDSPGSESSGAMEEGLPFVFVLYAELPLITILSVFYKLHKQGFFKFLTLYLISKK